ncbi:MAG: helix-turn-helix transcriptional regulator [Pseudomonadota bacterium]
MESDDKNGGPNHLAAWREYRKMTQQKLADAVGTNANMISMLENAERGLSAKWLRRLAPVLETTPGMLLDHNPFDLSADVVDIWTKADTRQKKQLSEIARTLVATGTNG